MTIPCSITVLVVEDEPLIRRMLRDELEDARMVVSEARDAADALAVLARAPFIEAILTDIHFKQGLDGSALARWQSRCDLGSKS